MLHSMRGKVGNSLFSKTPSSRRSTFHMELRNVSNVRSKSIIRHQDDTSIQDHGYILGKTIGEGSYCKVKVCSIDGKELFQFFM